MATATRTPEEEALLELEEIRAKIVDLIAALNDYEPPASWEELTRTFSAGPGIDTREFRGPLMDIDAILYGRGDVQLALWWYLRVGEGLDRDEALIQGLKDFEAFDPEAFLAADRAHVAELDELKARREVSRI